MEDINKKMDDVLKKRGDADYECYMVLKNLMNTVEKPALLQAIAKANFDDTELAEELVEAIEEAMSEREKHNEEFLSLLSKAHIEIAKEKGDESA
jgi:hypothetical protein